MKSPSSHFNKIKSFLSSIVTFILCISFSTVTFASATTSKPLPNISTLGLPAVQVMYTNLKMNSVGGVSPTIGFRNNSSKTIKYIDWYLTAYNAVDDPVKCDITRKSTAIAEEVGPIAPFSLSRETHGSYSFSGNYDESLLGDLFKTTGFTYYRINNNDEICSVNIDKFGNFYTGLNSSATYLNDDEIYYGLYNYSNISTYEICWYNYSIDHFRVTKAVITFMDGSKTTISGNSLYSPYCTHTLANQPFKKLLEQYSSVYNYADYLMFNPDLAVVYGDNQKDFFEHFINFGMKEGRQGSSKFNLDIYKTNNPDLVALFGDDNAKYYEHYISSGKAEGRIAVNSKAPNTVRNAKGLS